MNLLNIPHLSPDQAYMAEGKVVCPSEFPFCFHGSAVGSAEIAVSLWTMSAWDSDLIQHIVALTITL